MATFKNQVSAFIFKNLALSKRRKGSQIGLLFVFQALIILNTLAHRIIGLRLEAGAEGFGDIKGRRQDHNKWPEDSLARLVSQSPDYIRNHFVGIRRGEQHQSLFLVINAEAGSNEKVETMVKRLKTAIGPRMMTATDIKTEFKSAEAFDIWYTNSMKVETRGKSDEVNWQHLAGVFIVKKSAESADSVEIILNAEEEEDVPPAMIYYLLEAQRGAGTLYNIFPVKLHHLGLNFSSRGVFGASAGLCIIVTFILFVLLNLSEKEDKILMLMQLNGVTINGYLVSQLVYYFFMELGPFIMGVTCLILNPNLQASSPPFIFSIFFLLILMIQVPLIATCYSFLFKTKIAAVSFAIPFAFIFPIVTLAVYIFLKLTVFLWIPIYGTFIGIYFTSGLSGRTFGESFAVKEFYMPLIQSVVSTVLIYFLTIYLYNVVEQGYSGTLKKWHYPVTDLYYLLSGRTSDIMKKKKPRQLESVELQEMDSDVKAMMDMCDADPEKVSRENLLVYSHINKIYPSGNQAVDDVTFALKGNKIFGLLGPNGAGKTTLMHITAGLYETSSGRVILNGIDSTKNRMAFHSMIGFCPQHDIFWKELTVQEHLQFFFILRGSNPLTINRDIANLLHSVRLGQYAQTCASKLSGGERRRLSLAMAMSGESKVILLDEPTTGLDPKVRRIVWDIITEARGNRLLILTTHSMEEAELLSSELTIMAHGRLKCFGNVTHLKKKFGGQIFVSFENSHGRFQDAVQGIKECCPPDTETSLVHEGLEGLSGRLRFSGDKKQALMLMKAILAKKSEFGITSFGVVQSSLDDVFMNIVRAQDADA